MANKWYICPNGHRWPEDEEHERCPVCGSEDAETIGSQAAQHDSTNVTGAARTQPSDSHISRFGRYKIVEELGRGGMGIVYRAFDPIHEREVALKTLPSSDPMLLSRFKREFRVLAGVDHPNVVKLFELNSDGENWFFTMELVEGVDLLSFVGYGFLQSPSEMVDSASGEISSELTVTLPTSGLSGEKEQRVRDGFAQLAEAIDALHGQGIVHRDIKPSNVVVTREGRVVLLDFGLVAETDSSGSHRSLHQGVMGTAAYMSPEQAACDPVSLASDWYSVGVMLYQSLTGKLPISGKTLEMLVNKQNQDPVAPNQLQPSVSQEWNDLCVALLRRDPGSRATAEDVLRSFDRQSAKVSPASTLESDELSLVGRDVELQSLNEAWRALRNGQAKCIFVEGASGTGKSALVDAFVEPAKVDGAVILRGRCYEMESVPFKAIDGLIDSLVTHLRHVPQADAAALMPRDVHALVRLFPVIGQVEAVANLPRRQVDILDQQDLNRRAMAALRELLARMGDRCPLVVYIDDLQWGDEDSAAMLSDLLQPPDPPVLLFLGTYRSEDADTSQFLQSFRQIQRQREVPLASLQIEVTPLDHTDSVKLALALLWRDDDDAKRSAESVAREAAGNPFFISELVKHLQLEGEFTRDSTEPLGLVDMIWSRVQLLPDESQRLLAVVALWGQPLPLDHAMHIADVGQSAIGPLRTGHLIRTVTQASFSRVETYHDRIRESVSTRLDRAAKQRYHLLIAEDYVQQSPLRANEIMDQLGEYLADRSAQSDGQLEVDPTWYEVAFHFDAADRSDLAFSYALASAEKSHAQFSLEVSEQQYRIAERGVDGHVKTIRCRVSEGLADVLMLRGNYVEAATQFEIARELVIDNNAKARIEGKIGELAFKRGNNTTAALALEQSLRLMGRRIPFGWAGFMLFLAWEVLVQFWHTMFPKLFLARRSLEGADKEFLAIRLYTTLAYAYFFDRGKVPCLWSHLRGINLAERYPPTLELGHAWATHAPVMSLIPWFSRGEAFAKKSFEVRKELGDVWGQGQALSYWGIVLSVASRFDDCISKCAEAVRLFERTGDFWELHIARYIMAVAIFRKGDLPRAVAEAKRLYGSAHEMGDDKVSGFVLDVWSRASGGRLPAEITQREMHKERHDVQATTQVLLSEAIRLLAQEQYADAVEVLTRAQRVCGEVGMVNDWVVPVWPWKATALRLQCQKSNDTTSANRRQLLRGAHRVGRQAMKLARKFQSHLPHALREAGLISAMQGSERRALKYLDESLDVAERQGARFEHAQTLFARGSVGVSYGWTGAQEETAEAEQALTELGADFALSYNAIHDQFRG